ncbi:hypothetical protein HC024_12185 [Methylococcaceae bacterium WWC4]|nr:hypothetical protein [Methylococcaceae bacterium WWC4]
MTQNQYRSIFTDTSSQQRSDNFEDYWRFTQEHSGELLEAEKNLSKKRDCLQRFQENPVRLSKPLANPEAFYRNYVALVDDPESLDRITLMLCAIYKFARHEWVGIKAAWDVVPDMAHSHALEDKISRIHLAEEFCHVRLFDEMLKTCGLDKVEWVPLSPLKEKFYQQFPKLPGFVMDTPAFVTELMGVTFYCHLYRLFDEVLVDEPEVRVRLKALLDEITIDEVAHVGQRRNFIGPVGIKFAGHLVKPLYTLFFNDIPEIAKLFDIDQMIEDGMAFDFNNLPGYIIERSWIPSYCKTSAMTHVNS